MSYQKIEGTFWTDPKIQQLSPQEKLLFVYLITNSHVHYSGIYYLPKSVIAEETGLPNHTISNGLESLMDGMLIRCDDPKKIIWVINMARYQVTQGNKVNLIKGFASQFNKLHKSTLIKEFLIHYQSLVDGILNPSEWDTEPMPESVAVAVAVAVAVTKPFSSDSDEIRLAELLLNLIRQRNPNHKQPNIQTWAKEINRMGRIDKRDMAEVETIIRWCQTDSFWQNNILSTGTLREKFDQLVLKREGGKPSGKFTGLDEKDYHAGTW